MKRRRSHVGIARQWRRGIRKLNETQIALIPKKSDPKTFEGFNLLHFVRDEVKDRGNSTEGEK